MFRSLKMLIGGGLILLLGLANGEFSGEFKHFNAFTNKT